MIGIHAMVVSGVLMSFICRKNWWNVGVMCVLRHGFNSLRYAQKRQSIKISLTPLLTQFTKTILSFFRRQCSTKKRSASTRWPKKTSNAMTLKCKVISHLKELLSDGGKNENTSKIQMPLSDHCKLSHYSKSSSFHT